MSERVGESGDTRVGTMSYAAAVIRGDAMREGATPAEADAVVYNALIKPVADTVLHARIDAVRTAQKVLAGEDTVEWARTARGSLSLSYAIEMLDLLAEDYGDETEARP